MISRSMFHRSLLFVGVLLVAGISACSLGPKPDDPDNLDDSGAPTFDVGAASDTSTGADDSDLKHDAAVADSRPFDSLPSDTASSDTGTSIDAPSDAVPDAPIDAKADAGDADVGDVEADAIDVGDAVTSDGDAGG